MLYKKLWLNLWVFAVTTFAVVWIEISGSTGSGTKIMGHNLRGGVD